MDAAVPWSKWTGKNNDNAHQNSIKLHYKYKLSDNIGLFYKICIEWQKERDKKNSNQISLRRVFYIKLKWVS
jgi:hypothetical protein